MRKAGALIGVATALHDLRYIIAVLPTVAIYNIVCKPSVQFTDAKEGHMESESGTGS